MKHKAHDVRTLPQPGDSFFHHSQLIPILVLPIITLIRWTHFAGQGPINIQYTKRQLRGQHSAWFLCPDLSPSPPPPCPPLPHAPGENK